jgi:hypothetical protein
MVSRRHPENAWWGKPDYAAIITALLPFDGCASRALPSLTPSLDVHRIPPSLLRRQPPDAFVQRRTQYLRIAPTPGTVTPTRGRRGDRTTTRQRVYQGI